MTVSKDAEKVLSKINRDELVQLALDVCNIDSPTGYEKDVLEFIYAWLDKEGFSPKKVGMLEHRYNIVGTLKGKGKGHSLLFNAHTDTTLSKDDTWIQANVGDPIWHSAWRDGDSLIGYGIVNDKGPLTATLIAAKALKQSGVELKGDLLVTAVCSEISRDPVDDQQPPKYYSREIGAEYLVAHGTVADYALVAESSAHAYSGVLSGMAAMKMTVTLEGMYAYIPYLKRPTTMTESPNAIVRMAKVIEAFEDWAYAYQQKYRQDFDGATVIPKASIVGIRGGDPTTCGSVTGVCSLYAKAFTPPGFNPMNLLRELQEACDKTGISVKVELYGFRPGYAGKNTETLTDAIGKAHQSVFNEKIRPVPPEIPSMWRDCNVFNGFGIPSVTYGPGGGAGTLPKGAAFGMAIDELYGFAKAYALIALDICNRPRT
ncbi:MAG: M20/M25/M40 family metallo-hydrolase [Chloroflexota bacterium]|nr:M20/M25/M40 family metallo-hydrolase [Chloroflexota bacterium]